MTAITRLGMETGPAQSHAYCVAVHDQDINSVETTFQSDNKCKKKKTWELQTHSRGISPFWDMSLLLTKVIILCITGQSQVPAAPNKNCASN